ncbi:phosphate ABC transporter substrate-binding protein PstS [Nocardioides sp. BP30]|uniref:phosphate ABC transporter substrate-binding protein PstS n=1 Tax=Nocardioides sp. BP30 TaxID=3036374 RepID=UPI002468305E|nr:phosphate ABC transporter substrate-binding protein PstS [Nocardioides sp. BP30]WGL52083.1 phosphate ABC transporter substrate-binding protein PstS [Nocardioides sp. BP30]
MKTSLRRAVVPGVAALALAASLAACGDDNNNASDNSSDSAAAGGSVSGKLAAGGSSAQGSAQQAWMAAYQQKNSGVTITYDPVGSGAGRTSFESGAYPFAGSDAFIANPSDEYTKAKSQCGADPIEVPDYISPIAVVFNLKGVDSLKLDAKTIAGIFAGKITKWNDPAIAQQNSGVNLPSTAIHTVHRSDDSGTTQNFTEYLNKAGEGAWSSAPSQTWPSTDGLSGNGTSGVITAIKGGDGTIGYADASQAGGLGVVSIKVGSSYNAPSAEGAAAVVAKSDLDPSATDSQLIYDVNRTDGADGAYPLLLVSYLIACPTYSDANTANLVKGYLSYIVSQDGQQAGASAAGSAPLSSDVSDKATAIIAKIAAK